MDTRFTYDNFVNDKSFTLLEPIFEVIVLFSVFMLIIVMIKKVPIWISVLFASFTVIISGLLLFFSGIIVDELGLGGNSKDFFCFIATVILQSATVLMSLYKSSKNVKIPQRSVGN
ncbi:hypothetical protein [Lysinibacillus sphaericus]|uniref:Uncharacterized protein n=1 Tax=Lysinibacillus sphaericus OT4b.31 TaxID=1285586 RepID=R7ZG59_LYSSH|nr:hypothetical protein [Lysinibacillus sphaericus]EON73024.1 hypothetical protein H131_08323 [Lysinibacillus sphaericus OT4b.31]